MRIMLLACLLALLQGRSPAQCTVPSVTGLKLEAYMSYESHVGLGRAGDRNFSFSPIEGGGGLFLDHELPPYFDPDQRLVYIVRSGAPVDASSCPAGPEWTKCAAREAGLKDSEVGSVCEASLGVPQWRPSPESPAKRSLALEVLQELMKFGYENPKAVYAADFNIDDPELLLDIVDRDGRDHLQGCHFDATRRPHCGWHLFGQGSVDQLRAQVMEHPYVLFPLEVRRRAPR
jgi:hypothetical protein